MALPDSGTGGVWMRYVPHVLMTLVQLFYTLLYFIAEAAFNRGLNPHVYVTYRHLFVVVLLLPFAYYYEKKQRPKMTFMLFLEIFVLSFLGNMSRLQKSDIILFLFLLQGKHTSPAFLSSLVNSIATITCVLAIVFRMEIVDVKSLRGLAEVAGTLVSFAGVTTITLYKGTAIASLWRAPIHIQGSNAVLVHESWVKGSFLAVASCICRSLWYILQASSMKRYPAKLSLTAWMSLVGGIQSAVFALFMEHKLEDWLIGFGLKFWCVVYTGITCNGCAVFAQLWCDKKKAPVFVTMFNPLCTVMVAILAYFIFGEKLYIGSIIGGAVVILGLYILLWGKDKDQEPKASKENDIELDGENQAR